MSTERIATIEIKFSAEDIVRFHNRSALERREVRDVIRDCALAGLDQPIAKKGED
jgi:hypothetical protein